MFNKTISSDWATYKGLAIKSFVICLLTLLGVGIGTWFILDKIEFYHALTVIDNNDSRLKMTLIMTGIYLLLMIWPMCEYIFKFHVVTDMFDTYKWYVSVIIMVIVSLLIILISTKIALAIGWITVIQIIGLLIVIFVPRLFFRPY